MPGDEQEMTELFEAEEASGVNKHELYKQNKEAKLMDRLERRMEGELTLLHECYMPCLMDLTRM